MLMRYERPRRFVFVLSSFVINFLESDIHFSNTRYEPTNYFFHLQSVYPAKILAGLKQHFVVSVFVRIDLEKYNRFYFAGSKHEW